MGFILPTAGPIVLMGTSRADGGGIEETHGSLPTTTIERDRAVRVARTNGVRRDQFPGLRGGPTATPA
jgi:hypothetical protein